MGWGSASSPVSTGWHCGQRDQMPWYFRGQQLISQALPVGGPWRFVTVRFRQGGGGLCGVGRYFRFHALWACFVEACLNAVDGRCFGGAVLPLPAVTACRFVAAPTALTGTRRARAHPHPRSGPTSSTRII